MTDETRHSPAETVSHGQPASLRIYQAKLARRLGLAASTIRAQGETVSGITASGDREEWIRLGGERAGRVRYDRICCDVGWHQRQLTAYQRPEGER